ncbi:MAG: histidine kinase [Blautia sp.]|jgi:two-component system sensor histidine kinase YesM
MKKSMRTKILILFLSFLVILTGCSVIVYKVSMDNIYELSEESVDKSMEQLNKDMNKILTEARKIAYFIAQDADMQVALRTALPTKQQELYKERRNFNYALNYTGQLNENIQGIFAVGENGSIYRSVARTLYKQDFRGEDWYRQVMETGEDFWIAPHPGSFMVHNLYDPVISLVIPIRDRISYRILGVIVVDVAMEIIQGFGNDEALFNGETYIANGDNEIIYCKDFENIDSDKNEALSASLDGHHAVKGEKLQDIWVDGTHYLIYEDQLNISDWKLVNLIPYKDVFGKVNNLQKLLLGIIAICLFLAVVYAVIMAHWISGPIQKIKNGMQKVENGDFSVRVNNNREDELGDLINGFNVMTSRIEQMTTREQENQKALLKAELNALQAQINPHFLYNTLDSINWMVRMNRNDEVSEMIDSLIMLFRVRLSKGRLFISVEEELCHVEKYFQIQKIRYSRILNYRIEVPESLYSYTTIKMILQPLAENAIYHGLKEKGEPGDVIIKAEEQPSKIVFCVEDTGVGIKEEKLQEIRRMMDEEIEYNPKSYGVINVQKRIKTYFGPEYGLRFESEYGKGTRVYVTIPKRKEMPEYDETGDR